MRKLIAVAHVAWSLAVRRARSRSGKTRPADAEQNFTLSMKVQLVVEAVVVKDKQGNPIHGPHGARISR